MAAPILEYMEQHKMKKLIVDVENSTEIVVDFTPEEVEAFEKSSAETLKIYEEEKKQADKLLQTKQIVLDKLGLNEQELRALFS